MLLPVSEIIYQMFADALLQIGKLVDIIIGDASCKPELSARAKQLKIAVVSSEYIVQCLINGRKLPFDSAKSFHPNASVTSI